MKEFFYPSSVVVIGVSARRMNLGKEIARNLFEFGYTGVIHLVGSQGGIMFGREIRTSVEEITEPIDLALVLTPARTVPEILEQCGRKGIKRIVVESGGFGEFDDSGRELEQSIRAIVRRYDMRLIGPNCIGIMNSANGLTTPFTTLRNVFRKGSVAIIAQSGGVGLTFLNMFNGEQLGFSKFAAIGNKLNVDENDLLEYFVKDPDTSVICLYLESIGDGRRLMEIGRRAQKPIVVHKANIGSLSQTIAQSHTEALANDDQVVDAALRQCGMVRFRDLQGYLDFLKILQLPQMKGRNLAIVSRSGGHAVIAADAAHMYGFQLPRFRQDFLNEIRTHLRADVIRLDNPLDLGDLFDFSVYLRIIEHTLQEESVDGVLFLHTYMAAIEGEASRKLLQSVGELARQHNKPVAMCISTEQFEMSRLHKEFDFPIFLSPERAVHALDKSLKHQQRREFMQVNENLATFEPTPDDQAIGSILNRIKAEGRSPLLHEALEIVVAAGVQVPAFTVVRETQQIEEAFAKVPGPLAVKVIASDVSHKSDRGGVVLGLTSLDALRNAVEDLLNRFGGDARTGFHGVLVQSMAPRPPGSYELIVGGKRDPQFGPVVLLGHGGVLVEVLGKTSLRVAPLSPGEVDEMIKELPGSEMLDGVRGLPPVHREKLKDTVLRVAHLLERFPIIDQIDINPVLCSESESLALDARIVVRVADEA